MAKGRRGKGGSGGRQRSGGSNLPGRRGRKRQRGGAARDELPTAAPGAAQAPVGASAVSGNITAPRPVQRPQPRAAGGPRFRPDRRAARRLAVAHDFRYVGSDLRWIAMTTVASAAVILLFWVAIRL